MPLDYATAMPTDYATCPTEVWLSALQAQGRSPGTIASHRHAVGRLRRWADTEDLATITRLQAMAFARFLGEGHKPGGVAIVIRSLRAGWSWMVAEGLVESNVFARMRITVPEEVQSTATDEQIAAMLRSAARSSRRDQALLTVLVDTGCRRGELAAVQRGDLDLRSGTVTFRVSKTQARTVPLSDRAIAAVARYRKQPRVLTESFWCVGNPYELVNAVVQRHSGGALRAHALRRAFAVRWLERGGSELGLQRIAGWKSLAMVRVYVRARADVLAADEFRRLMS